MSDNCLLFTILNFLKFYEINIYEEIKNRVFIQLEDNVSLDKKSLNYLENKDSFLMIKNINDYIKYKNIPNVIIDCKINTFINNNVFNYSKINKLVLPKQINNLSCFSFASSHLTKINLENVLIMGNNCFQNCSYLEEITMPKNILQIENFSFYNCLSLKRVVFPKDCSLLCIKNGAFNGCISLKYINIPDIVNEIQTQSFYNSGLEIFRYPMSITYIYNDIFCHSNKLKLIKIPKKFIKHDKIFQSKFTEKIEYY